MFKFVEISLSVLLLTVIIGFTVKVGKPSSAFVTNQLQDTTMAYANSGKETMSDIMVYNKPIPVTSLYVTLMSNMDIIASLTYTLTTYGSDGTVTTVDCKYVFDGKYAYVNDAYIANITKAQDMILSPLKYMFSYKMKPTITANSNGTYNVSLALYNDNYSDTGV